MRAAPTATLLGVLLLAAAASGTAAGGEAGEIALTVDWNGVRLGRPFPVTGGVPFPRGALTDARAVRLLSGGRGVPVDAEPLAFWPDGSVKWLLLDFQALTDEGRFTLRYGRGVRAGARVKGIAAVERNGAVRVDTGAISFVVRRDGCGFTDELSYRGSKAFDAAGRRLNLMDMIHTGGPEGCRPMNRYVTNGRADPSRVELTAVRLERAGPLRAVVLIDGLYKYRLVGSTIEGTSVKGDCPFRVRIHAYAGQSFLKIEHFFCYEGDGDRDFVRALALKVPLPPGPPGVRFIGADGVTSARARLAGLHQQSADSYELWTSDGSAAKVTRRGGRFEGVLDVTSGRVGVAVGVRGFWRNAAKSLHADLVRGELGVYLWPPESPPLDFRRHAREWSVGETGSPDDKQGTTPAPIARPNYRLASKGVGKTHYAFAYFHDASEKPEEILAAYSLFNARPLLWAPARHYAESLALGRYRERIRGENEDIEEALDLPVRFWRHSQERFRWYGFWLNGNVCQTINNYMQIGRWEREFGRWGWSNGDSMGRLGYALVLQAVRGCRREDFEFAERYLHNIHDVCSIHTSAYPEHYRSFAYLKGTSHRHGAWPWACPYTGIRGSHPVGAKIHYYLTGEGRMRDILDEVVELALKRPSGGMGDGPLGPNAQAFIYRWETAARAGERDEWRERVRSEIVNSDLKKAKGGWQVMMNAAFGIYNALEEYMDLTGDRSLEGLAARFADEASPDKMKRHWTWGGYYRVYAAAYNVTGDPKYARAIEEMLPLYTKAVSRSAAARLPERDWPPPAGGPRFFANGNSIRDIPFALYALELARERGHLRGGKR